MKLVAVVLALGLSTPLYAADKLTLGFMTTLSGPGAVVGNDIRDGMRLALDHLNNRVGGLPTSVLIEDDRQKPEVAIELANKFIRQDRADALIGFMFSNILLAAYQPIVQSETVLISSNAGPSQIAGKDSSKYFFSTSWNGESWAAAMRAYLTNKGIANISLLTPTYTTGETVPS